MKAIALRQSRATIAISPLSLSLVQFCDKQDASDEKG